MKLRNLLFAVATCAGLFTACSNEMEDAIDNGNNSVENAEAYAAVSFVMPSAAGTRAGEEIQVGTQAENQVTNVTIALFDEAGNLVEAYKRERTDFTPDVTGAATTYSLMSNKYIAIETVGKYSVHVIVNPTAKLTEAGLASVTTYNDYVEFVERQHGEYCTDNNFMMTNATPVQAIDITKAHTKTNPANVQINVERLAAKITFKNDNVKEILGKNGANIGTITFDAYKVVNTRNSAWGLRRVGTDVAKPTIGGAETLDNYVFENNFTEKATFTGDFYEANYSRKLTKYVAFRTLDTKQAVQTIAYSLENTMKERLDQNKGYTTGIILRGKATLNENQMAGAVSKDGTFYRLGNTFYGNWNELLTRNPNLDLQKGAFGTEGETEADYKTRISNNKKILYQLGIELYAQGYCYYYYWLNHRPDGKNEEVGMMEYAIVRNNVYALEINSVKSIGNFESGTPGAPDKENPGNGQDDVVDGGDNPELPGELAPNQEPATPAQPVDPTDPVIDNNTYLKVTIDVNPWTVRKNQIDL